MSPIRAPDAQKIPYFVPCNAAPPAHKIGIGRKLVPLSPQYDAGLLKYVVDFVGSHQERRNIAIDTAVVPSKQLRKSLVRRWRILQLHELHNLGSLATKARSRQVSPINKAYGLSNF